MALYIFPRGFITVADQCVSTSQKLFLISGLVIMIIKSDKLDYLGVSTKYIFCGWFLNKNMIWIGYAWLCSKSVIMLKLSSHSLEHGLRTPGEKIAFTARPQIKSQSRIYRYGRSIICLPHQPKISDFFDLCLHWVSVVRAGYYATS